MAANRSHRKENISQTCLDFFGYGCWLILSTLYWSTEIESYILKEGGNHESLNVQFRQSSFLNAFKFHLKN